MPYIKQERRTMFDDKIDELGPLIETEGDLNYVITRLCHYQVNRLGIGYAVVNGIVGVLESAKLEFYRRVVAPYEDRKIALNGDVSPEEH